jgi:hypothetical protein
VPNDPWHDFFDLRVYRGAVASWLDGGELYDFTYGRSPYGFTYPPFAALLVLPMGLLPYPVVAAGHVLLNVVVLAGLTRWLVVPLARRHGWPLPWAWLWALPLVFVLEPVRETIGFGQVNLFLLALVLADVAALRRGSRWAGVGIGLAAAVKLTPGLFVVWLLLTRRWRAARVAVGTAAAATLLASAVAPATSWRFWTGTLWQTERVGRLDKTSNQSLLGALARLADPGDPSRLLWAVLAAAALAFVLTRAVRATRAGDDLAGVTLAGLGRLPGQPGHLVAPPRLAGAGARRAGRRRRRDAHRARRPAPGAVAGGRRGAGRGHRGGARVVGDLVRLRHDRPPPRPRGRRDRRGGPLPAGDAARRRPAPGEGHGRTCRSAKSSAVSTWRIVSSMTSEPCPASKRYTSCGLPELLEAAR